MEYASDLARPWEFTSDDASTAVILVHGLTASPAEMRPLGQYLNKQDDLRVDIYGPCLPGHGTKVEDLARTQWQEWLSHLSKEYQRIQVSHEKVILGGLSLGSLLVLLLASQNPKKLAGLILMAPPYKLKSRMLVLTRFIRYLKPYFPKDSSVKQYYQQHQLWSYLQYPTNALYQLWIVTKKARNAVHQVTVPAIIFNGEKDDVVHPNAAKELLEDLNTSHKTLVSLPNSGHILTVEPDKEVMFSKIQDFIKSIAKNHHG